MDRELNRLLEDVKNGDAESFEILRARYIPLMSSMVEKYSVESSGERYTDDLVQESTIALYSAACHFDAERGEASFGTYAKACIRNRLIDFLHKNCDGFDLSLIGDDALDEIKGNDDPAETVISTDAIGDILKRTAVLLTEYEFGIFHKYLEGYSVSEISDMTGREKKSVENAVYRIRKKLKSEFS